MIFYFGKKTNKMVPNCPKWKDRYARPLKDRLPPAQAEKGHISSIMNRRGQDAIAPIVSLGAVQNVSTTEQ